jgi:hypothetical protein
VPAVDKAPVTQKDLVRGLGRLPLPMPRTMRELFQLFTLYDPAEGLAVLLDRLDFAGVTPYQIYQIVHARAPEQPELVARPERYDPRAHLEAALCSAEFQERVLRHTLQAFPEKRRNVFIHVPKCAGTDLILNLGQRHLSLPKMIELENWVTKAELFEALCRLVQAAPYYETFFVYGHIPLGFYIDSVGIRAGDRIFTVIRDPIGMMLSQANYAVTRLRQDPLGRDPDTREILQFLGLNEAPNPPLLAELKQLAVRALLHPEINRANQTCFYLGGGAVAGYAAAITNLVRYDVEITTTGKYGRWLQERWGIASSSRHNTSDHWLSPDDLDDELLAALRERTGEDQKVFETVSWVLAQKGTSSVTGTEIAETVGSQLLDGFADNLVETSNATSARTLRRQVVDFRVIQGKAAIGAALQRVSKAEPALSLVFGAEGNARPYLRDGWANPEPNFVWTAGPVSRLEIPKPRGAREYRLRLLAGPFVMKERLLSQRLTLAVNGIVLGTAVATEQAVIECAVPEAVLGGGDVAELTFTLPDAARPVDVTGADDRRTLAFAVERLELFDSEGLPSDTVTEPSVVRSEEPVAPAPPEPVSALASVEPVTATSSAPGAALPLSELMLRFESLGENCEFGLVQRRCGAEPLGLFRFASAPLPKLIAALDARFEGLSEPANLEVQLSPNGREYLVADKRFQLLYHAWVMAGEMTAEEVHRREVRRLPLLIRKLSEDLSQAEKIFVFHGMEPLSSEQAGELLARLRAYGANTLLWVELADAEHRPGTVELCGDGLLKGYIDRFAPGENAHDLSLDCWVTLCRNADGKRRMAAALQENSGSSRGESDKVVCPKRSLAQ